MTLGNTVHTDTDIHVKTKMKKSENINVHKSMICLSTVIYSCNVNYFVPFMHVRGFECMWIDKCLEMIKTRRLWF